MLVFKDNFGGSLKITPKEKKHLKDSLGFGGILTCLEWETDF